MATAGGVGVNGTRTGVAPAMEVVFPVAPSARAVADDGVVPVAYVFVAGSMDAGAAGVGAVNAGGGAKPFPLHVEPTIWTIRCGGTAAAAIAACCIARAVMVSL